MIGYARKDGDYSLSIKTQRILREKGGTASPLMGKTSHSPLRQYKLTKGKHASDEQTQG